MTRLLCIPMPTKCMEVLLVEDHCPIIMSSTIQRPRTKAFPFRFQNFWCNYQNINTIVVNSWKMSQRGTNMFKLMRKLKHVKLKTKEWAKKHLGNTYDKLAKNACKIDYVEGKLIQDSNSYRLNSWMHRLLK